MSNLREAESEAFNKWFSSQKTYSSLSAMERALNITKGYLHLIKDGSRRAANPELRRKLKEATGLKEFEPITNTPKTSLKQIKSAKVTPQISGVSSKQKELPENLSASLVSALKKLGLTLKACSQKYKIALGNLKKYKSGVRKPTSEKNIAAVLNILNDAGLVTSEKKPVEEIKLLEHAVDISTLIKEVKELGEKVNQIDAKLATARLYQEMSGKPASSTAQEKARVVMRLLMSLSSELEYFKNCTEDERRIFKETVPGQDVGYITTLLRALYDEDKFQKWLFFSTYTMKGKGESD